MTVRLVNTWKKSQLWKRQVCYVHGILLARGNMHFATQAHGNISKRNNLIETPLFYTVYDAWPSHRSRAL